MKWTSADSHLVRSLVVAFLVVVPAWQLQVTIPDGIFEFPDFDPAQWSGMQAFATRGGYEICSPSMFWIAIVRRCVPSELPVPCCGGTPTDPPHVECLSPLHPLVTLLLSQQNAVTPVAGAVPAPNRFRCCRPEASVSPWRIIVWHYCLGVLLIAHLFFGLAADRLKEGVERR